jgi:DNA-binding HxlR family transcriptional regulator
MSSSSSSSSSSSVAGSAALSGPAAPRSRCPVATSLDLLGDRWTLLVVRDLNLGKARFADFLASPEHIPTNILADRLKRLERAGLIEARRYSDRPPRSSYHLTDRGRALGPVLDALAEWGLVQFPGTRRASRSAGSEAASDG